jgi:hypothetical protein
MHTSLLPYNPIFKLISIANPFLKLLYYLDTFPIKIVLLYIKKLFYNKCWSKILKYQKLHIQILIERQKSSQTKGLRVEILRQQNATRSLTGWIGAAI